MTITEHATHPNTEDDLAVPVPTAAVVVDELVSPTAEECETVPVSAEMLRGVDYGYGWSLHDQSVVLAHADRTPLAARLTTAEHVAASTAAVRRGLGYAALTAPTPPTPAPSLPKVVEDDLGGRWWAEGHVAPEAMVLAVVLQTVVDVGPTEAIEVLAGEQTIPVTTAEAAMTRATSWAEKERSCREAAAGLLAEVRHQWMIHDDSAEVLRLCDPTDEGAEPWTTVAIP